MKKTLVQLVGLAVVLVLLLNAMCVSALAAEPTIQWSGFKIFGDSTEITGEDNLKYSQLKFEGKVNSSEELNFTCILILTDDKNRVVKVEQTPVSAASGVDTPINCTVNLTDGEKTAVVNGYQLKVFFWDSLEGQTGLRLHSSYVHGSVGKVMNGVGADTGVLNAGSTPLWP